MYKTQHPGMLILNSACWYLCHYFCIWASRKSEKDFPLQHCSTFLLGSEKKRTTTKGKLHVTEMKKILFKSCCFFRTPCCLPYSMTVFLCASILKQFCFYNLMTLRELGISYNKLFSYWNKSWQNNSKAILQQIRHHLRMTAVDQGLNNLATCNLQSPLQSSSTTIVGITSETISVWWKPCTLSVSRKPLSICCRGEIKRGVIMSGNSLEWSVSEPLPILWHQKGVAVRGFSLIN